MGYDPEKHLVGRETEEITLNVDGDSIDIKVRKLPWSKKNQIVSTSMEFSGEGKSQYDGDRYLRECLKYIIVEAPWGNTTDTFLSQVGPELGAALDEIVPKAFVNKAEREEDSFAEVKKEQPSS
jgi:hypothetical protein